MRFTGTHRTTYTYSAPVFLHPHKIRLRPRSDAGQYLREYSLNITPKPDGMTEALDAWGNNVSWVWFSGQHETLEITIRFVVDRVRLNPFDFIVPTIEGATLPPAYPSDERAALQPYFSSEPGPRVRRLAEEVAEQAGGQVVDFATALAERLHENGKMIVRPEGAPMRGQETLAACEGSCRDIAVVYIEACRHVGIASRFVSGYVERHVEGEPRELHAWAGVYVPGAGWRGFDPTQGLAVSTGHITLATAASPSGAAPVTGSFIGDNGVEATLDSHIELEIEGNGVATPGPSTATH
jgi:transglutaminase-like putative cysteine protease